MYKLTTGYDATTEIADAASVVDWMSTRLEERLPPTCGTQPDFTKLALAGHSRGGKVAFGLALGLSRASLNFSALAVIDPVDGAGSQTPPPILTYKQHSLVTDCPTLIVGSGLGPTKKFGILPACAPPNLSHQVFFNDSCAPAYHFVAPQYGHMDFLDDSLGIGEVVALACSSGPTRKPVRRATGGLLVALFQSALLKNETALSDAIDHPEHAPCQLAPPEVWSLAPVPAQRAEGGAREVVLASA
eukprot:jgi/Mesen1/269/ME1147133C09444